ncbi:MFS transporter [Pseudorhodoferax sp.]|uniref:MFS transporter n=1 Tax=Pseudorhodoferax sp. TaxID=1993553 RepID=UPI002DD670F6|nr:MFS transporter [Pseudorhodoferax sp.]
MTSSTVRARWAARFLFFACGFLFATWGVHIPTVKAVYGLGVGAIGGLVLAAGLGSVLGLTQAGWLIARHGARRVAWWGALVSAVAIALLLRMPNLVLLWLLLGLFGMASGLLDVAMNADASELERQAGRPMMSAFHGMFSLGGMAGAGVGGLLISAGVAPDLQLLAVALGNVLLVAWSVRQMVPLAPQPETAPAGRFQLPRGRLALVGLLAALGFVVEGAMYDWSVLFLQTERGAPQQQAALAYASFSAAMAATRFVGDRLRARWSAVGLLRASAGLAAVALALVLLSGSVPLALVGFALVGVGLANVVPVLFSAAAQVPGVSPAHGISAVASLGYCGFMVGPSIIGFVAHGSSLTVALGLVVGCALAQAALARRALRD